jgi:hypothetical protein
MIYYPNLRPRLTSTELVDQTLLLHYSESTKEAREVALKKYRPIFENVEHLSSPRYFDQSRDNLYLRASFRRYGDKVLHMPKVLEDFAFIKNLVALDPFRFVYACYPYYLIAFESLEVLSIEDRDQAFYDY